LVLILRYYIDQGEIANSLLREKLKGIERRSKGSKRGWLDRKKEARGGLSMGKGSGRKSWIPRNHRKLSEEG
jgi:hypothetical protein